MCMCVFTYIRTYVMPCTTDTCMYVHISVRSIYHEFFSFFAYGFIYMQKYAVRIILINLREHKKATQWKQCVYKLSTTVCENRKIGERAKERENCKFMRHPIRLYMNVYIYVYIVQIPAKARRKGDQIVSQATKFDAMNVFLLNWQCEDMAELQWVGYPTHSLWQLWCKTTTCNGIDNVAFRFRTFTVLHSQYETPLF